MENNDGYGRTALMYAVCREDYNTVKLLLDNGADVNMKDNDGKTALMYAVGREDYNYNNLGLNNTSKIEVQNPF